MQLMAAKHLDIAAFQNSFRERISGYHQSFTVFTLFRWQGISCSTRAYMLRGFFADVALGKWRPKFPTFFYFLVQNSIRLSVGILLKCFCRKLLQLDSSRVKQYRVEFKVCLALH